MEAPQIYSLLTLRSYGGKLTHVKYRTKFFSSKEQAEADLHAQKLEYYGQDYMEWYREHLDDRMCCYEEDEEEYLEYKKVFEKQTLEEYSPQELEQFEQSVTDYCLDEWYVTLKPFEYVLELVKTE
jgi:hypothetical protein